MTRHIAESSQHANPATSEPQAANLDAFLIESKYCDVSHPSIQELAQRLTGGVVGEVSRARVIFEWVRDEIRYVIPHDWSMTASETLAARIGSCTNKANLLVALLRAVGIPAAYEVLRVRGKFYLGPVWVPMLQQLCDDVSCHVRAAVFLDGRWLKCDTTNDSNLTHAIAHMNSPSEQAVFDGEHDAVSFIHPDNVLGSLGLMPNGDPILGKRTTKPPIFFTIINRFLEMGRELGAAYRGPVAEIEPIFHAWLQERYPAEYAQFYAALGDVQRAAA
jgi:hypothetical protein